jgi:hypothetical protein
LGGDAHPPILAERERLRELDRMHANGVVNDAEYAEQRKRILDAL